MGKNLEIKKLAVLDIAEKIKNSRSMVMVKYSGLTVEQATQLRVQCRAAKVDYRVYKNSLIKRALEHCGITGLDELLVEPNAFAFSEDPVTASKVICDYINKDKVGALELKGGILDGKATDIKTIQALATMPSREELLARLMGSMTAAVGNFVRVLEAIRKQKAGEDA